MATHQGAFEYDWRTRFHLPLSVVGTEQMTWAEAVRLYRQLAADWSTAIAAARAGWEYPMSREALVLADLFDLQHFTKSKRRPKQYPRPWSDKRSKTFGRASKKRTSAEVRAILDKQREQG